MNLQVSFKYMLNAFLPNKKVVKSGLKFANLMLKGMVIVMHNNFNVFILIAP